MYGSAIKSDLQILGAFRTSPDSSPHFVGVQSFCQARKDIFGRRNVMKSFRFHTTLILFVFKQREFYRITIFLYCITFYTLFYNLMNFSFLIYMYLLF